ncbi:MAG TPA: DMT family transporter [Stellaceae bacterium]|nr:DMT family transporter [Stellaceae bacterium]
MVDEVAAQAKSRWSGFVHAAAGSAILIWGATPLATRIAVLAIDPLAVGVLRTLLAALLVLPLALALRLRYPHNGRQWLLLTISAIGGFVIFPLLFGLGVRWTSTSHAALIVAAAPLFTAIIGAVVERRRLSPGWWLGAALAMAGEAVLIVFRAGGSSEASVAGDLMVLLANLGSASGYVAGARLARDITTWGTTFWGIVVGALCLLPIVPFTLGPAAWHDAGLPAWGAVAYLALGATILGYVCWYWALRQGGIARIGTMQFLQPLVALVLAMLVLHEEVTPPLAFAGMLIVAGVAQAQRR